MQVLKLILPFCDLHDVELSINQLLYIIEVWLYTTKEIQTKSWNVTLHNEDLCDDLYSAKYLRKLLLRIIQIF